MNNSGMLDGIQPFASGSLLLNRKDAEKTLRLSGFSNAEKEGRWSKGPEANISFRLPKKFDVDLLLKFEFDAFVNQVLLEQVINVSVNGVEKAHWVALDRGWRRRALLVEKATAQKRDDIISIDFSFPDCTSPASLGLNADQRRLGIYLKRISWRRMPIVPPSDDWLWQLGRPVGGEARKTFDQKIESGFWARYINGPNVLDIGFKGYSNVRGVVPITPAAKGIDLDYPGYDGRRLPFEDQSQDAVYSSHCLEHIKNYREAIADWYRVTKIGGHIITVVPHAYLYERAVSPPSKWNQDHKRFYTPSSLLAEFELALKPNSYRVRYLEDNDESYAYSNGPNTHPFGCYEIVLVIQKIASPTWELCK
jgi:predicted SAM-dependent methyltransferase